MTDDQDQPERIEVPIIWVGAEDLPVVFANQFVVQVDRGEVYLTIGQLVPPAIIGATDEERRTAVENLEHVQVKPVARLVMTPSRLHEFSTALQMGLAMHSAQEEQFGDPRKMLEVNPNSTTAKPTMRVGFGAAVTNPGQRPPLFVARDEIFFWTAAWQAGERASAAERDAGKSIVFDSEDPEDIIRWLHADDEPDTD